MSMRECICCQCAEHSGEFKDYAQCESCGLYGHYKDEFENGNTVCHECVEAEEGKEI